MQHIWELQGGRKRNSEGKRCEKPCNANWEGGIDMYAWPCVNEMAAGSRCVTRGARLRALWWLMGGWGGREPQQGGDLTCEQTLPSVRLFAPRLQPSRLLCLRNCPGKNTGAGCHFLLQGIFPTQRLNPGLLHCRQTLYRLSRQRSPGEGYM